MVISNENSGRPVRFHYENIRVNVKEGQIGHINDRVSAEAAKQFFKEHHDEYHNELAFTSKQGTEKLLQWNENGEITMTKSGKKPKFNKPGKSPDKM